MAEPTRALIAAAPGRIRDSWQALLKAVPRIQTIELADEPTSALQMIADQRPGLVLVDSKLMDNLSDVLRRIKTDSPRTRCIVFADTFEQQWLARNAGANSVLLAGCPAELLFGTVEGVLSWPERPPINSKQQNIMNAQTGEKNARLAANSEKTAFGKPNRQP
jgi:DNA-binding NarL/FixJ family response regulator